MPDDASPAPLTTQLTDEYGDLLPPSLIGRTVEAARTPDAPADELAAARTARADVAAMADAVLRRPGALPPSA